MPHTIKERALANCLRVFVFILFVAAQAGEAFTFFFGRETWAGGKPFFTKSYTLPNTSWIHITENLYQIHSTLPNHITTLITISNVPDTLDPPLAAPTTNCAPGTWPSCQRPMVQIYLSKSMLNELLFV